MDQTRDYENKWHSHFGCVFAPAVVTGCFASAHARHQSCLFCCVYRSIWAQNLNKNQFQFIGKCWINQFDFDFDTDISLSFRFFFLLLLLLLSSSTTFLFQIVYENDMLTWLLCNAYRAVSLCKSVLSRLHSFHNEILISKVMRVYSWCSCN